MVKKNKGKEEETFHLTFWKECQFWAGCARQDGMSKYHPLVQIGYKIYSKLMVVTFVSNFAMFLLNIPFIFGDRDLLMENLSYSFLYTVIYPTLLIVETDKVQNLFKEIDKKEVQIKKYANRAVRDIYTVYNKININNSKFTFYYSKIFCILFVFNKILNYGGKRRYVLPQYIPVNVESNWYWVIVVDESYYLAIIFYYMMYTKFTPFAFITYILAELKVLQHFLVNCEGYAKHIQTQQNLSKEEARFVFIRECVKQHDALISYVANVRDCTRMVVLLDFFVASLQFGIILIELTLLHEKQNFIEKFVTGYFLSLCILCMWLSYYYANEILIESVAVANHIYVGLPWYNYSKRTKEALMLMMLRAQRPLSLSIGPISEMSLEAFLKVLKGSFSYLTFIKTAYE